MTVENVKKMRELAEKGKYPMVIVCDNEHYFIENSKDSFTIMWDDANETFTVLQPSAASGEFYTQSVLPLRVVICEYSTIQFIEVLLDRTGAINQLNEAEVEGKLTNEQWKKDLALLSRSCAVSTIPNTNH